MLGGEYKLVGCLIHKLCQFLRFGTPAKPLKNKKVDSYCQFLTNRAEKNFGQFLNELEQF